jgi:hypothetical protein
MRPEEFRNRLGLPEDKEIEMQWKYEGLCGWEQKRERNELTSINPQQPRNALAANSFHIGENVGLS